MNQLGGRKKTLFGKRLLVCFIVCASLFILGMTETVFAEDEGTFTLEEITVTAEKREAELQKIPMEISVLRTDEMKKFDVNQVYDLEKILPDISTDSQVGTFVIVSIREVETGLWNPMFETTVSTHLDGIQLTRFGGMENFFYDLERVEVLKGPQGTLYGRGSTAGSINMITKKPVMNEFGGSFEVELGDYDLYRTSGALNIPIVEKLAVRVAGRSNKRDSYSDLGYGDADSMSGRISIRWTPTEKQTFTVSHDRVHFDEEGYSMFGDDSIYLDTYGDVTIVANSDPAYATYPYMQGGPVHARFESLWAFSPTYKDNNWNRGDLYGVGFQYEYKFDFATLTVEAAHRNLEEIKNFMWGGAYLNPVGDGPVYDQVEVTLRDPILFVITHTSSDTDTIEARLTSTSAISSGDSYEWIIGAMMQDDKVTEETFTWFAPYYVRVDTQSSGIFGQASYSPFDKWNITGGVRWNKDKKDYMGIYLFETYFDLDTYTMQVNRDMSADQWTYKSFEWSEPTYKINISYEATNDMMAYLQYSKGYRSGNVDFGANAAPPEFLNAWELGYKSRWFDNRLQFNAVIYYYDYKNYNRSGTANKCLQDTDSDPANGIYPGDHYCDDVASNTDPTAAPPATAPPGWVPGEPDGTVDNYDYDNSYGAGYVSVSPGGAEQKGVSVNLMYLLTMNDTISLNAVWRHNEYGTPYGFKQAILAVYPEADNPYRDYYDESGREFGGAPIRGNMGYTRTFMFGSDILTFSGTLFYNGKGIDQFVNYGKENQYTMPGRDAYWTGDISATYQSGRWMPSGTRWFIRFRCNNVWDEDALDSITYTDDAGNFGAFPDAFATGSGVISGRYINPRSWGITFGVDF